MNALVSLSKVKGASLTVHLIPSVRHFPKDREMSLPGRDGEGHNQRKFEMIETVS